MHPPSNLIPMVARRGGVFLAVVLVALFLIHQAAPAGESTTPVAGGSAAQRTLLRQIIRAMGGTQISRVRISSSRGAPALLLMSPSRLDRSRASVSVRLEWDAYLVAYSFLKLSLKRGLPPIAGFSISGQRRTFRNLNPRVLPPFTRSRIVRPVGRAVNASGATVVEFNLFLPAGPAFAVVVAADHPARFIERRLAPVVSALNGDARRVDGFYVAVVDARRSVVFAYGRVELRGQSSTTLYVRGDLRGCAENLPVSNEVAPDGAPPCPRD